MMFAARSHWRRLSASRTIGPSTITCGGFENVDGTQTVTFDEPVEIVADSTYVASYHTSVGFYAATVDGLAAGHDSGPLHVAAGGGAYLYGAGFPANAAPRNYFVDVVFHKKKKPEPTPTATEPAPSASPSASETATASPTPSASTAPGGNGGGGGLPVTGVNAPFVAGAGLVLAVIGGLLAWRHRRRTTRFVA